MSILTEVMPDYVIVEGSAYPINTDFRVWLEFDRLISARSVNTEDRLNAIFRLCFSPRCRILPKNAEAAMSALYDFYMREKTEGCEPIKRVLSFEEDADYIYAAFLAQYDVDLLSVPYMHWHSFYALLKGLEDNTRLMRIISIRSVNTAQIKDKERRECYQRLQKVYALSDDKSELEKDFEAAEALYSII